MRQRTTSGAACRGHRHALARATWRLDCQETYFRTTVSRRAMFPVKTPFAPTHIAPHADVSTAAAIAVRALAELDSEARIEPKATDDAIARFDGNRMCAVAGLNASRWQRTGVCAQAAWAMSS
ncbi:hypothetical protein [Burkholderia multivorans]|uniref:hypothetical protein n=1 Tax=Burkholderia multivorans TaxID=87883 RepID=UPI002ED56B75